jgi:hypothetical protein
MWCLKPIPFKIPITKTSIFGHRPKGLTPMDLKPSPENIRLTGGNPIEYGGRRSSRIPEVVATDEPPPRFQNSLSIQ